MAGYWDLLLTAALPAAATYYGMKMQSDANNKATAQMTKANDASLGVLKENRTAASPGLIATQGIINRGAALTPEQEMAVADSRDQALNALHGSSLRGSARATSAIVSDTDKRVRNNFMTQNQNRADSAAIGLAGQFFGAGRDVSQGLISGGDIQGSNTIGQGQLRGQAVGDIGAIIADQVKDSLQKERTSSYARVT